MEIINYWKNVAGSDAYLHPEDLGVLNDLEGEVKSDIDTRFPPGPYFGPIATAKIILCYANPSTDTHSIETVKTSSGIDTLFHQLDGQRAYPYELNGWRQWFSPRANSLFEGNINLASKNMAVLNLVPYASKNMDNIGKIANCLPSSWAAQKFLRESLIPKAMRGELLLIMCRASRLWGLRSSHGSEHILINDTRSGFCSEVKLRVKQWRRLHGI